MISNDPVKLKRQTSGTILWLCGWSMPDAVFDRIREFLPDFHHVSVDYSDAGSSDKMLLLTEMAVDNAMASHSPLLIGGWSLGGLLALRLAAKGLADGLVLFGATARFTRTKGESDLGFADIYVRKMITGLKQDRQGIESRFRELMFSDAEREDKLDESLPPIGSWTTPALIAGLQILRSEECLSQLKSITCPVFIVHGTDDCICPYGAAVELMTQLPKAKLFTMPACGHASFLGREDLIANELRRWWHEQQDK
ncbi:alpha/beta hydrolase [Paenibacillus sp. FSL A5-0031]|uniref:alpha/beta fold hydrolase n=1 Tax=Paenibacillus sp. FSL A5-0031 TaxID=1920420 RepID=UPI00096C88C6|nr:alpha/beta fold hydrolase [Paenibacillus sp. FSL A5-0031]OME87846.1 alpha/beta hydrolase [Paenibacillus sp. FSL A5-0031]